MMPPMKQFVSLLTPGEETDKYGRPLMIEAQIKARVELTTKVVETTDGTKKQAVLEVDFRPEIPVGYGSRVRYIDDFGNVIEGSALSIDESKSLSGKKTYFRTVLFG